MHIETVRSAAAYARWRPAVSELFCKVFERSFPEDVWDLYYRDNPFGEVSAAIAVSDGKVVGHHALIPQILTGGDGATVRYLQSISLMTDPDYRNVFLKLVRASHVAAAESDAEFILSFNNPKGAAPLRQLFGHEPIVETPLLTWTPRQPQSVYPLRICPAGTRRGSEELSYPSSAEYWKWRTAVNRARAVKLNDRTELVYKVSGDTITVLDIECSDRSQARADLLGLAPYHQALHFRISGYHAQMIETFGDELTSHEDYILRFYGRKLKSDVPTIRFSLLLSDVF